MMDMTNVNMDLGWKDISNESYRTYLFPSKVNSAFSRPLVEVTIDLPKLVAINFKSGGHRVIDAFGNGWYIPAGWVALKWEGFEEGVPAYNW